MADERLAHVINCSADDFWTRLFFDPDYNRGLFLEELRFSSWHVDDQEETPQEIRRTVAAVPAMPDLPKALSALVREGIGYVERGVFERATRHYRSSVETKSLSGKLSIIGDTYTEPLAEGPLGVGRCLRVHVATAEAKIFGVGRLLEGRIIAELRTSYEKAALFSNRWIEQQRAAAGR